MSELYLGCISGTSVDGLDIALVEITAQQEISIVHAETVAFDAALRDQLLALGQPEADDLDQFGRCDRDLGIFIGTQLLEFLSQANLTPNQIHAIGSHGQTVRHRPPADPQHPGFSLQIGDPSHIAEITGIQTVADFRRRDLAAGGHGAPLVPPFHAALFAHLGAHVGVLNVGGISNLSLLGETPTGFDSGPGNALMDSWYTKHHGGAFDTDGQWAKSGTVDDALLNGALQDPYFDLEPPKSTGREYFNLGWLDDQLQGSNSKPADVQATLCEITARATTDAIARWAPELTTLIVCGGGRLNSQLMAAIAANTKAKVAPSEQWTVDGDSIEAALFGWLAHKTVYQQPGNEPKVTGASGYRVLGVIHPA